MSDLLQPAPNALNLCRAAGVPMHAAEENAVPSLEDADKILTLRTPFLGAKDAQATPLPTCDFADLGFILVDDPQEGGRAHIQQTEPDSTASALRFGRKTLRHHCLLAVNGDQAYDSNQALQLPDAAVNSNSYPITLSVAPVQQQQPTPAALEGFPLLHFDQLRHGRSQGGHTKHALCC